MHLSRTRSMLSRSRIAALVTATAAASLAAVTGAAPPAAAAPAACPWVGSSAPISQRVSQLLAQMSTTQKVSLLTGASGSSYVGFTPAIGSLCIPAMNLEDGPAGVGDGMSNVTQLPAPVDAAATWDTSAEQLYGQVIGSEQAAKGTTIDLGPTINIVRDPRWGRAFESIGEDPYLNGTLGAADIQGVQSAGVMAQVKHFAVYNQETNRNTPSDNAVVSNRTHAGDLPAGVPGLGPAGRRVVGDVLLQHHQRHLRLPEPVPADHRAAPAVRLRRVRHLRLGRHARHRRLGERRAEPGHARQRRLFRRRPGRRACPAGRSSRPRWTPWSRPCSPRCSASACSTGRRPARRRRPPPAPRTSRTPRSSPRKARCC